MSRAAKRPRTSRAVCALLVLLSACGSSQSGPTRTLPLPEAPAVREEAFHEVGRRAFDALVTGATQPLLLEDDALRALLSPEAANHASALRVSASLAFEVDEQAAATLAEASYSGVCVQHAQLSPAGPPLGLRRPGFTFDRVLVIGREPGGGQVAAWVEGSFVYTDRGFFAVALQRLSSPRRDHADLDLAPCDLRFEIGSPRGVVVPGAVSY